ncbi:MAG: phage tail tube protein [Novosphingobium sp.]
MANELRRGGTIFLKINGEIYFAKGSFTYNLGAPKRDAIIGADAIHGYKEVPQIPFIEGEITDNPSLDLDALARLENATVTLELANGKVITLRDAWHAGEGTGNTEEGNIAVRFEGMSADEVK